MNPEVHMPGWEWYYVAMYFFIAGISAGAYFIGTLAELFGGDRHREISRTGFYIAFPLILLSGLYLLLVAFVTYGLGAYVAGRLRARLSAATADEVEFRDGVHGLLVWALATLLTGYSRWAPRRRWHGLRRHQPAKPARRPRSPVRTSLATILIACFEASVRRKATYPIRAVKPHASCSPSRAIAEFRKTTAPIWCGS